jgi:hypothetical protein
LPASGGRSGGIVRSQTKTTEFVIIFLISNIISAMYVYTPKLVKKDCRHQTMFAGNRITQVHLCKPLSPLSF